MKLYLVRHGDYFPKDIDPQCSLSEKGIQDIQRIAHFLLPLDLSLSHLFHSGKTRAQQTAEIISQGIRWHGVVETRTGLDPNDSVIPIASEMNQASSDVMLVGHMPFMGCLASKLLVNDENINTVIFRMGSVVCLERAERYGWSLSWVIYPELLLE